MKYSLFKVRNLCHSLPELQVKSVHLHLFGSREGVKFTKHFKWRGAQAITIQELLHYYQPTKMRVPERDNPSLIFRGLKISHSVIVLEIFQDMKQHVP
jgi:hypothetical protein